MPVERGKTTKTKHHKFKLQRAKSDGELGPIESATKTQFSPRISILGCIWPQDRTIPKQNHVYILLNLKTWSDRHLDPHSDQRIRLLHKNRLQSSSLFGTRIHLSFHMMPTQTPFQGLDNCEPCCIRLSPVTAPLGRTGLSVTHIAHADRFSHC